jgi:hypothetical protein
MGLKLISQVRQAVFAGQCSMNGWLDSLAVHRITMSMPECDYVEDSSNIPVLTIKNYNYSTVFCREPNFFTAPKRFFLRLFA